MAHAQGMLDFSTPIAQIVIFMVIAKSKAVLASEVMPSMEDMAWSHESMALLQIG
jgi:hypothetical protein